MDFYFDPTEPLEISIYDDYVAWVRERLLRAALAVPIEDWVSLYKAEHSQRPEMIEYFPSSPSIAYLAKKRWRNHQNRQKWKQRRRAARC